MPLMHCNECHHEWEGKENSLCDWCDSTGYVLKKKTGLESLLEYDSIMELFDRVVQAPPNVARVAPKGRQRKR